jgi:hypothetical protein
MPVVKSGNGQYDDHFCYVNMYEDRMQADMVCMQVTISTGVDAEHVMYV